MQCWRLESKSCNRVCEEQLTHLLEEEEEDAWEDKLSERQIEGCRVVSAAGLQRRDSHESLGKRGPGEA